MFQLELPMLSWVIGIVPFLVFFLYKSYVSTQKSLPTSYPFIGVWFSIYANRHRMIQWTAEVINRSPTLTFVLQRPFGSRRIMTANPANVQHILKTNFGNYPKGDFSRINLFDLLGDGIFNADGENWKFQRQVSSHEFNTRSLRNFVEHVVDTELDDRLIPILAAAAADKTVLDLQDILQRFAFDNICKIAFGYDPEYLIPSLPQAKFAVAFEEAVFISSGRFRSSLPFIWRIKRFLNVGSEKRLKLAVGVIREFAGELVKQKKQKPDENSSDLLSRFLISGHSDENFVKDIVISFILAGRDTTSAALTWFFWLLFKNPGIENEILKEINEKHEATLYEEVKDMVYTHASLSESMRLYPPVPIDTKEAVSDDILPDGTVVKKGMPVSYHPYAMGRSEKLWGSDWAEFRPERWMERDDAAGKWRFVQKDSYTYTVFQAGPRICLGKEMAYLQMKRVVAGVLRRFRVVPAEGNSFEPLFVTHLTAKMRGGFPVKIEERR